MTLPATTDMPAESDDDKPVTLDALRSLAADHLLELQRLAPALAGDEPFVVELINQLAKEMGVTLE